MKIIAGKYKGRFTQMPKGIRPTSDKVREALFEILKGCMQGASFLDLYCGSGAIGIEAYSRGAKDVTFVDNNIACIAQLKKNLSKLEASDLPSISIYKSDSIDMLKKFQVLGLRFDIIFLDPPYYRAMAKNTLIAISNCDILTRNAKIIAEIYKKDSLPDEVGSLRRFRTSCYGDTLLVFFK